MAIGQYKQPFTSNGYASEWIVEQCTVQLLNQVNFLIINIMHKYDIDNLTLILVSVKRKDVFHDGALDQDWAKWARC